MSDNSTQTSLVKSLGGFGGIRVTGESNITGSFMGIYALEDVTILGDTQGNISNISGVVVPQGAAILGQWEVVHSSGDAPASPPPASRTSSTASIPAVNTPQTLARRAARRWVIL